MRHEPRVRMHGDRPAAKATGVPRSQPRVFASATQPRYTARLFLEDEERLLAAGPAGGTSLHCVELPEGRLLPLPTDPLREAIQVSHECFSDRYGPQVGEDHERRFRLVLDYVDKHRVDLMEAGLAHPGEPMVVREEFLDFLLDWPIEPTGPSIPGSALVRFLDEWGLRWM